MTVFTVHNYDPIACMNAAKDRHRANGTTGGKKYVSVLTAAQIRAREDGMSCHEIALATVDAIWAEFRSWSANERIRPLGDMPDTDFPF